MRAPMMMTIAVGVIALAACSTSASDTEQPTASVSNGIVTVERGAGKAVESNPTTSTAPARPAEHGIVFGGFDDVLGGMTVDQVRARGWVVERTGGGDGCTDYRFRRGTDVIQVGTKGKSGIVSTVSVSTGNGRLIATTARIRSTTATYAQIAAAYPDATLTYTPPINRGPSGSVGKLIVASNDQPDRAIVFTNAESTVPQTTPPPSDTQFSGAQGGTLSALDGGTFGCA